MEAVVCSFTNISMTPEGEVIVVDLESRVYHTQIKKKIIIDEEVRSDTGGHFEM